MTETVSCTYVQTLMEDGKKGQGRLGTRSDVTLIIKTSRVY